ncbi:putative disease resistance RPP13-like protein 1 [Typha latifolia]|uniref:putative disease resistance RPP13-like protein 1 n=1 Tax=Typha latifolia TaxID=4733 RepID=UPI003C2C3A67
MDGRDPTNVQVTSQRRNQWWFDVVMSQNYKLRDIMYDAEDIVDECRVKAEELRSWASSSSSVSTTITVTELARDRLTLSLAKVQFRREMGSRIQYLNQLLDELFKDKSELQLIAVPPHGDLGGSSTGITRSTSHVAELDLVGERIGDDTRSLVELLTISEEKPRGTKKTKKNQYSILAIVGMGGIGKTTLAQKIFNDERLLDSFSNPIWVCVSQEFSEVDLLRAVIKRAGGDPGEDREKEDLEPMLSQLVKDKRFFLVLDDVWDARVWEDLLRKPMRSASPESRILLTTRHEAVANRMGATQLHHVEKLSDNDGWSLVSKMVFEDGEEGDMDELKDVGMRIVRKCDGLPLALKAIGGFLRTKKKRIHEWEKVVNNSAWSCNSMELPEEVSRALYLSYQDLPSHLKQCFTCLSLILSEDRTIKIGFFVRFCAAEGFVKPEGSSSSMASLEDLAEGYWQELIRRSILQPNPGVHDGEVCRMHDLVLTLSRHLSSKECFFGSTKDLSTISLTRSPWSSVKKLRRLAIFDEPDADSLPDLIMQQTTLRTLVLYNVPFLKALPLEIFEKLRFLRTLVIRGTNLGLLPASIGCLVHLRFLGLFGAKIREIPKNIGNLKNLEYLDLESCTYLESLPQEITTLTNLKYLDLRDTSIDRLPAGLGKLLQLNTITAFVVSGSNKQGKSCTLGELKFLNKLKHLRVLNLERVSSKDEARAAMLEAKSCLRFLTLSCTPPGIFDMQPLLTPYQEEEIKRIEQVFEELCLPSRVELLHMEGYYGRKLPSWFMVASLFPNLRILILQRFNLLDRLPTLGLLPQLDILKISGANAITSIGSEFLYEGKGAHYSSSCCFPKLTRLFFENMPNWEEWLWLPDDHGDDIQEQSSKLLLPRLEVIGIIRCPKLRCLPDGLLHHATSLKQLTLAASGSITKIKNLHSVQKLELVGNSSLVEVSNLPHLRHLKVQACKELRSVRSLDALKQLMLSDVEPGQPLPKWLVEVGGEEARFPSLTKLSLKSRNYLQGMRDWPLS